MGTCFVICNQKSQNKNCLEIDQNLKEIVLQNVLENDNQFEGDINKNIEKQRENVEQIKEVNEKQSNEDLKFTKENSSSYNKSKEITQIQTIKQNGINSSKNEMDIQQIESKEKMKEKQQKLPIINMKIGQKIQFGGKKTEEIVQQKLIEILPIEDKQNSEEQKQIEYSNNLEKNIYVEQNVLNQMQLKDGEKQVKQAQININKEIVQGESELQLQSNQRKEQSNQNKDIEKQNKQKDLQELENSINEQKESSNIEEQQKLSQFNQEEEVKDQFILEQIKEECLKEEKEQQKVSTEKLNLDNAEEDKMYNFLQDSSLQENELIQEGEDSKDKESQKEANEKQENYIFANVEEVKQEEVQNLNKNDLENEEEQEMPFTEWLTAKRFQDSDITEFSSKFSELQSNYVTASPEMLLLSKNINQMNFLDLKRDIQLLSLIKCTKECKIFHAYSLLTKSYVMIYVYNEKVKKANEIWLECCILLQLRKLAGIAIDQKRQKIVLVVPCGVANLRDIVLYQQRKLKESELLRLLVEIVYCASQVNSKGISLYCEGMQGIWLNGEKKDTMAFTGFEHSMKNRGSEEWEQIGGWGKSPDWCPPELFNFKNREICLELVDVYWVGQVIMRLIGMSQEEIKEIQDADRDDVCEKESKERKNKVFEKYIADYKFIIQNILVNILERDKFRHSFRDLKIYLDKVKPLYNDVKLNFNPEIDQISQQTLQQKLDRIEFYQILESPQQKEIKYLKSIGKVYFFLLKQFSKACQYFEKVQKLEEEFYGIGDQKLIKIYKLLIQVYIKLGIEYNVKALSLLDQLQSINYQQNTLEFILKLKSKIAYKLGNFDESVQYFSDYLQIIQNINGEKSIKSFEQEIKLGNLYRKMRNNDFSIELHQQCLEQLTEVISENQQDDKIQSLIKKCKYQMILDYYETENFDKVNSLLDEIMQNQDNLQSYQYLHFVNLKAFACSELNKKYEQESVVEILEKNASISMKQFGVESYITSECYYYLSQEYLKLNNIQKAAEFGNKSLKQQLKIFPEHKPSTILCYNLCAILELKQNNTQKAVVFTQKAFQSCQIVFATNSLLTCKTLQLLGDTNRANKNYLKSQEYLEQAFQILKNISPSQKFNAEIYLSLNLTLNILHDYERSKQLGTYSINNFFENMNQTNDLKMGTIECLGESMMHTGDQDAGMKYYEQVLDYKKKKFQDGNSTQQDEIIKIYIMLGSFLNKSKNKTDIEKSIAYFQIALAIQVKAKSENSQEVLALMQLMLLAYQNINNKKKIKEIKSRIDKIKNNFLKQHC